MVRVLRSQHSMASSRRLHWFRTHLNNSNHTTCTTTGTTTTTAQPQHRCFGTWPKQRPVRIRAIMMDVTGTLVSFRGSLSQHYLGSAAKCGVQIPANANIDVAFAQAYKEISDRHPCFGHDVMSGKEWWKHCVLRSLELAGATSMSLAQKEGVFQRIYSVFGSQAAYERFDDALPFLQWARRNELSCGLLSNADDRYGDSILPMLGLTQDELQFQCFSKDFGIEKPDSRFFRTALQHAQDSLAVLDPVERERIQRNDPLLPSQIIHIGNDYTKDFEGARRAGMHAVLLDRYNEVELAAEWKRRGAVVLKDLMDVVEFIGRSNCVLGSGSRKNLF